MFNPALDRGDIGKGRHWLGETILVGETLVKGC